MYSNEVAKTIPIYLMASNLDVSSNYYRGNAKIPSLLKKV